MKIRNFKRKLLTGSLILIFAGAVIALTGFSQTGFSPGPFEEAGRHRVYQTVYVENGALVYGVQLNDSFNIIKIGGNPFHAVCFYRHG